MSIATAAITEPPPAAAEAVSAAALAARIPVPVRLPVRYDGEPMRHLSHSAYSLWVMCREAYRRKYICGERDAPSGAMFLGSRVDDAVSLYYRHQLAGERLDLDQVKDAYRELWQTKLEAEQEKLGVAWADIHPQAASTWDCKRSISRLRNWCRNWATRSPCNASSSTRSSRASSGRFSATSTSRRARATSPATRSPRSSTTR